MTPEQITALAATGESETLEFKRTTGTRREAARTVCAMLNQRGGHVLFGVTPEGDVVGQQVSERTMEEVSAEIQRIDPAAFPEIERVRVTDDLERIAVRVSQGSARPYQYRGTACRPVGNTTVTMSAEEYNQMLFERLHSEQRWENQPATGWTVEDLDVAEVRNTVAEAVRIGRLNEPGSREPEDLLPGSDCSATASCFERRWYCSATRSVSNSRCRSVCFVWLVSGVSTEANSWTTGSSTATHLRCSRMPNASCATRFPSRAGLRRAAPSASTSRSTRLSPHGKRWRTPCAAAITLWAVVRWASRCATTAWRSP